MMKDFILKYSNLVKVLSVTFGTVLMFIAYFFSDRPFRIATVLDNISNPVLYVCLGISFLTSLSIHWGLIKKEKNKIVIV